MVYKTMQDDPANNFLALAEPLVGWPQWTVPTFQAVAAFTLNFRAQVVRVTFNGYEPCSQHCDATCSFYNGLGNIRPYQPSNYFPVIP
jgi:hypothetical protein